MLKKTTQIILLAMLTTSLIAQTPLTDYVNPFLGTAPLTDRKDIGYAPPEGWRVWAGLTFPGASLPNAMVQLSPITEFGSGAGYEYEDTTIYAFTHTNKGHWNLCHIPSCPSPATSRRKISPQLSATKTNPPNRDITGCFWNAITSTPN